MARRPHPQDKAGEPPPERRCTAMVTSHRPGAPYRCSMWTLPGLTVCRSHSSDHPTPSHNPPPERRCQGKSKDANGQRTKPCKLWAIRGLTVCYRHGGANKTTRAAGDRRVAEAKVEKKARQLASLFDIEPVDNPLAALAQHVGEEIRFKDILATLVKDLHVEEIRYTDARGAEQLRSEIVVYERALGRVGDRLVAYARLGIDERLVKIEEAKAEVVMGAINAVIGFLGATGQDAAEARRIAARHLKAAFEAR